MTKYMTLKHTDNWSKIVSPVLDAYNNSPHSTTNYPILEIGDNVRVPVTNKV